MSESTTKTSEDAINAQKQILRNFRVAADVENFYRFIYENNLRSEAKLVFDSIIAVTSKKRKKRSKKVQ
jgi:hypothetical protein